MVFPDLACITADFFDLTPKSDIRKGESDNNVILLS